MSPLSKPILCAVCNQPVESVEIFEQPLDMTVQVRVSCHGQTDEAILTQVDLAEAQEIVGVAFLRKSLVFTPQAIHLPEPKAT